MGDDSDIGVFGRNNMMGAILVAYRNKYINIEINTPRIGGCNTAMVAYRNKYRNIEINIPWIGGCNTAMVA